MDSVLIVGAGLAGSRCAETLRAEGFAGRIHLVGEEEHAPYERPALSKELLAGTRSPSDLLLRPREFWDEQEIELSLGVRIATVDPAGRTATAQDGRTLEYDALVLATGARPRRLAAPSGVHHLRTLVDALALRMELEPGSQLAIVGAGFVGGEVASTAAELGVDVTVIDTRSPLERLLGPEIAAILAERYRAHGVRLRLGSQVTGFRSSGGRVSGVSLDDGSYVLCDAAVVGIGIEPAGELLGNDGGIVVDAVGRTAVAGVYACGDVVHGCEHWTSAAGRGTAVARTILGRGTPHEEQPYFWSDQFGLRIQVVGRTDGWQVVEIDGDSDCFGARYLDRDGCLLAGLLANRPREVGALRRELALAA